MEFEGSPVLRGEDETKIRVLFTTKLLNLLESKQNITVEGGVAQLILYRDREPVRPEKWQVL